MFGSIDGDVMRRRPVTVCGALVFLAFVSWLSFTSQLVAEMDTDDLQQVDVSSEEIMTTSLLDGVYSVSQAERGRVVFDEVCAACHMPDEFSANGMLVGWDGQAVNDLFESVSAMMPEDNPGSLSRNQTARLLSFMLLRGRFPGGATELPVERDALGSIRFLVEGPS